MPGVVVSCYCVSPVQHLRVLPLLFVFLRIATRLVRFVLPSSFFLDKYVFLIVIFLLISVWQTSICHREKRLRSGDLDPCTAICVSIKNKLRGYP